jgi:hypothetical protein
MTNFKTESGVFIFSPSGFVLCDGCLQSSSGKTRPILSFSLSSKGSFKKSQVRLLNVVANNMSDVDCVPIILLTKRQRGKRTNFGSKVVKEQILGPRWYILYCST